MTDDDSTTSRRGFLAGTAALTAGAAGFAGPAAATDDRPTAASLDGQYFRVRIENVSTPETLPTPDGSVPVPLSPGAYAAHEPTVSLFDRGEPASPGIEDIAEDGMPSTLAESVAGADGVTDAGAFATPQTVADPNQPAGGPEPPIFPGGAYEFTVRADDGDRLSFATMFIQSNDLFYAPGPEGIPLFEGGHPVEGEVTEQVRLWDASTEGDQQPGTGPDQAPRQDGLDTGPADDNSSTVQPVSGVNAEGYSYPATGDVIRVTVEPIEPTPFVVTIENVSTPETLPTPDGSVPVPLSPGAYAVHESSVSLFDRGEAASPGIEAIAEDGMPGTLAGTVDGLDGVRVSGAFAGLQTDRDPNQPAGGPEPPIFPGGAYTFAVAGVPGDRLSFATMFIQSNDLFYAPDPTGIPLFEDGVPVVGDVTEQVRLWDASTEGDQQPGTGPDQAPRQDALDTGPADDNSSTVQPVSGVNAEGYSYPDTGDVIRVRLRPLEAAVPVGNADAAPGTLDDDPLLEDVDGDGDGDLFDALHYYDNRNSAVVQNNPDLFDFDGDGDAGDLFDALELFEQVN